MRICKTRSAVALLFTPVLLWVALFMNASAQTGETAPDVPATADKLFPYLQAGTYQAFPAESAPHASAGPHGQVRTFINPILEGSLAAGDASHPVGAAAVKEMYSGDALVGWAVYVKTQGETDGGNGYYWYEVSSTTDPGQVVAEGNGAPACISCHAAGQDFTLSAFPLQ